MVFFISNEIFIIKMLFETLSKFTWNCSFRCFKSLKFNLMYFFKYIFVLKGQMAYGAVKWPMLRDISSEIDILITKSPSSCMEKTIKSPSGCYNIQRTKITYLCTYPLKGNRYGYNDFSKPLDANRFSLAKGNGKVLQKTKEGYAIFCGIYQEPQVRDCKWAESY